MPLYEYACDDCGPFKEWSTMDKAANPCQCPGCDRMGSRQIAAPMLALMNGTLRKALERSDKSSSEPRVIPQKHLNNCGCSLCNVRKKTPTPAERRWSLGH